MEYLLAVVLANSHGEQHPFHGLSFWPLVPSCLRETVCVVSLCRAASVGFLISDHCTHCKPPISVALHPGSQLTAQHLPPRAAPAPLHYSRASRDQVPFYEHVSMCFEISILFVGRRIYWYRRLESVA